MTYTTLISAAELKTYRDDSWVIIDCRFSLADTSQGKSQYQQQHLPGSVYAHLDNDLSSSITATSGRHPLPDFVEFAKTVNAWGIRPTTQVVAYDDAGGPFAARLWWLLKVCGHEQVAVLNGGLNAWVAVGGSLDSESPVIKPNSTTYELQPQRERWVDVNEVEENRLSKKFMLIDARTVERYLGDAEPIDTIAGRIPGALNLPVPDNLEQGKFKSKAAIRDNFLAIADEPTLRTSVHYCGSGVFACHNVLSMEYAGFGRARIYPGSWSEWIRDDRHELAGSQLS